MRAVYYGAGAICLEQKEIALPDLPPGSETTAELAFRQPNPPSRVQFDVFRPTCFSAFSFAWKPLLALRRFTQPLSRRPSPPFTFRRRLAW